MSKKILVQIQLQSPDDLSRERRSEGMQRRKEQLQEIRAQFLDLLLQTLPSDTFETALIQLEIVSEVWIQMTEEDYMKFKPAIESLPQVIHVNRLDNTSISIDI